jgi:peptidoglycan/LPS O-acetylase OafA/YrhL
MESKNFVSEIESLRGLAAFEVLISHTFGFLSQAPPRTYGDGMDPTVAAIVKILIVGAPSVMLFFVISGFALGNQMGARPITPANYGVFVCRRFIRLVPPMWVSLIVAYLASLAMGWPDDLGLRMALRNMVFLDDRLNAVLWSLRAEIVISVLFPLLLLAFRTSGPIARIATLVVLNIAFQQPTLLGDLRFLVLFYLGLCAASLAPYFSKLPERVQTIVLVAAVVMTQTGIEIPYVLSGSVIGPFFIVLVVLANAGGPLIKFLRARPIRYLGKISYSVYLLHFPVVNLMRVLLLKVAFGLDVTHVVVYCWILFVLTALVTIPLAAASYRWIELPTIALSRKIVLRRPSLAGEVRCA